jgi:hypothetical protein
MRPLLYDLLWVYLGVGQPPPDLADEIRDCSKAKGATAFAIAWSVVTAAGVAGGCTALTLTMAHELVNRRCAVGSLTLLGLLLAGSPLVGLPRGGLELAKATGHGVSAARLCVVVASTAWWTVTAVVGYFIFFAASR